MPTLPVWRASVATLLMVASACAVGIRVAPMGPDHAPIAAAARSLQTAGPESDAEAGGAAQWHILTSLDESGRISPGAMHRALTQRASLGRRLRRDGAELASGAGPWQQRGPELVGGRLRALLIDPRQPAVMWAGSVSGGLFKTTDGGEHWQFVDSFGDNLSVSCLSFAPGDPDTIYVGTGEAVYTQTGQAWRETPLARGSGIYRSQNGGTTWSRLPGTESWTAVNRITVSPSDPNRILVARGLGWDDGTGGIQLSTDGGQTWRRVLDGYSFFVAFDPSEPGTAIAHGNTAEARGAFFSADGGASWQLSTQPPSQTGGLRIEFAFAPSRPQTVYAYTHEGAIWRSLDAGRTFSLRSELDPGSRLAYQRYYNLAIWVDPIEADRILVADVLLWRSDDAGATRTFVAPGSSYFVGRTHVDFHCITTGPAFSASSRGVLFCTDGGIFSASDYRAIGLDNNGSEGIWRRLNRGFIATQFYSGSGYGDLVLGGTQDNGVPTNLAITDPGAFFGEPISISGGDGGMVAVDPTRPSIVYSTHLLHQLGGLFQFSVNRVNLSPYSFAQLNPVGAPGPVPYHGNFVPPLVLDPNDADRLYVGGQGVWVTSEAATGAPPDWRQIRAVTDSNSGSLVSALAVAVGHPDVVWMAQNDGQVFMTDNALAVAPTWRTVDDNAGSDPLPNRFPTRILVSYANPSEVYLAFGGFSADNLWRTSDGGASWESVDGTGLLSLPAAPVRGVTQHPHAPAWLFAGTEVGVYASMDGGTTWTIDDRGPGNVAVHEVRFLAGSNTLLAATHGRGLWTLDLPATSGCLVDAQTLCLGQGRFQVRSTWRAPDGRQGYGKGVALTNDTGYFSFFDAGNVEVVAKVLDGCGVNGRRWVFAAGLTNLGVELYVTDTKAGVAKTYSNPLGQKFMPIQDSGAFATCGASAPSVMSTNPSIPGFLPLPRRATR